MANNAINDERWVADRLASLEPPAGWRPSAAAGLMRFHQRERAARIRGRWWIAAMAAIVLGCGSLLALHSFRPEPAGIARPATPGSFKESGSSTAPVTCEVYTDYECPHCAQLYAETIPLLVAQYVETGRVKLVHRDFPLPQHPYSRLAARYANAAGQLGQYGLVVNRIFSTQGVWSLNGDIDAQVAAVLPLDVMEKVRGLLNDPKLDDSVAADMEMAREDRINQTPSLVIVARGKRQLIAGIPPFSLLKSYLDDLLK